MHILGGIDEVGYGCRLGPLVLVASLFQVPDPSISLWRTLAEAVCRRRDGRRLPVCDSKELFSQAKGLGTLEPTALAFLQLDPSLRGLSFQELSERLAEGCTRGVPWFRAPSETIPDGANKTLARVMRHSGIRMLGFRARVLEAADFNQGIDRTGNKHRLHFDVVADLVERVLEDHPEREMTLRIGKLSGRTFYLRNLHQRFELPVMIQGESAGRSSYRMIDGERAVSLAFIRDGDSSDFAIALSSIIAKYVRERWMKLFNAYWIERVGGLRPTAGYGRDASRFFEQIRPSLDGLGERQVFRSR